MRKAVGLTRRAIARLLVVVVFLLPGLSQAVNPDYEFRFNSTFSGTGPSGPAPWIDAVFHEISDGVVTLTISNVGLSGTEFIGGLYFNFNTNFNATSLSFHLVGGSPNALPRDIQTGRDQFKADGDGKYDILFDFNTSKGSTFEAGNYLVYQISGIPGLNVFDFNYLSAPAGGSGPFLAAAHVQSIGTDGLSGWIRPTEYSQVMPVPEPTSLAFLGIGSMIFLALRRPQSRRLH